MRPMTVEEARKYLEEHRGRPVPRRTMYNWMDSGKIPYTPDPISGRRMLYETDLAKLTQFQPATPKPKAKR